MNKLLLSLGLIITGMSLGYLLQRLSCSGRLSLPFELSTLRKTLQKTALLFFMPIAFLAAIWIAPFDDIRIVMLPIIAVSVFFSGALSGYGLSRLLNKNPEQTGVLICSGFFTNLGSIGGLVCYIFLGEPGFALVALYRIFEAPLYYTVGFPIAKYYSSMSGGDHSTGQRIRQIFRDPLVLTILVALVSGLGLNVSGIERPAFFATVTALSVSGGTFIMLVSVGLGMRFGNIGRHLKEGLLITLVKSLILPLIACAIALLAGLDQIDNGLPLKVVLILSSMPVAFNTLVASSLYDLDLDLANSCWLISTLFLGAVLPVLYFIISAVPN
jgi:predicted permease